MKIAAFDYDNTIVRWKGTSPFHYPEAIIRLHECARKGLRVGIISGRYLQSIMAVLQEEGIRLNSSFPAFIVSSGMYIYYNNGGILESDTEWNHRVKSVSDKFYTRLSQQLDEIINLLKCENLTPERIVTADDGLETGLELWYLNDKGPEMAEQALNLIRNTSEITDRIGPHRLERNGGLAGVVSPVCNKGDALLHVIEHFGLTPGEALAVGDSMNDLSMLDGRKGIQSATVGNADTGIKEAVTQNKGFIANGEAGEGVIEIIRHFNLG